MKRVIGIILIVLVVFAVIGGIGNGTFAQMPDKDIAYIIGYFGAMAAMVGGGIYLIVDNKKNK